MNSAIHDGDAAIPALVSASEHPAFHRWGGLGLVVRQIGYEQRSFWRNRTRAFFSFALPIMFLIVFSTINRGSTTGRDQIDYESFFLPGILAYGVIMTTFNNLASSLAVLRDEGTLKRLRGTPLPAWAFFSAQIGSSVVTMLAMAALTLLLGVVAFGATVRGGTLPGLVLALCAGTACFTVLGIAATALIPNAEAAPAVTNGLVLPLAFISGIFFTMDGAPSWLSAVADIFPVKALTDALQVAFDPHTQGAGITSIDLAVLAIWLVVGLRVARRSFRWQPHNS